MSDAGSEAVSLSSSAIETTTRRAILGAHGFELPGHRRNQPDFTPSQPRHAAAPSDATSDFPAMPTSTEAWTKTPNANMPWR